MCQHSVSSILSPFSPSLIFHLPALTTLQKLSLHFIAPSGCAAHTKTIGCRTGPHFSIASDQCCRQCFKAGLDRSLVTLRAFFLSAGNGHDIAEEFLHSCDLPVLWSSHNRHALPCFIFPTPPLMYFQLIPRGSLLRVGARPGLGRWSFLVSA